MESNGENGSTQAFVAYVVPMYTRSNIVLSRSTIVVLSNLNGVLCRLSLCCF